MTNLFIKNAHSLFNIVFLTFSSIVFILNIFLLDHTFNTALYFCNIMSFVIASVIILMYPDFLFDTYKDLFFGYLGKTTINIVGTIAHALPVYLFKDRQNLSELLEPTIIIYSFMFLLTYYIIFKKKLSIVYPASETELYYLAGSYFLVFSLFSIFR